MGEWVRGNTCMGLGKNSLEIDGHVKLDTFYSEAR